MMKKKKVEDCSVKELEKYYIQKAGYVPNHIEIYWYDVRFMKYSSKTSKYEVDFYLLKSDEIEVEENEEI